MQLHSLKKENKELMTVNSRQTTLNHASESYILHFDDVKHVKQDMRALLLGIYKQRELLRKEL